MVGTGALGAALLAIRAAGAEAGWAFQLQDPRTIMLLLLLATAITANLLGLFELPVLGGRARPAGSFGTGALAAFIATPCAGPFLGAALGTALLLPLAGSVLVFAALGLRPGDPVPGRRFRPGVAKQASEARAMDGQPPAFPRHPNGGERCRLACGCSIVRPAAGAPVRRVRNRGAGRLPVFRGRIQRAGRPQARFAIILALVVVIAAVARIPVPPTARVSSIAGAEPWSETLVAEHVQQGRPVFVYFTADWCLTCKANEVTAIDRSEVRDAFRKAGVRVVAGDWTNGDPAITRFLESRGRAGVPLYLWYRPGRPSPRSCRKS